MDPLEEEVRRGAGGGDCGNGGGGEQLHRGNAYVAQTELSTIRRGYYVPYWSQPLKAVEFLVLSVSSIDNRAKSKGYMNPAAAPRPLHCSLGEIQFKFDAGSLIFDVEKIKDLC